MKETTRPDGVLRDPWAGRLAGDGWLLQAIRGARFLVPPLYRAIDELQTAHCVRHRSIDELMLRDVRSGVRQVIVLGAGYDMRAARFADALAGVRFIELDLPAISERKRALVAGFADVRASVEYATIDLLHEAVPRALARTSFDPREPALFVLEGVLHYLPRARVSSLLTELAAGPADRTLVLSFIRTDVYLAAPSPLRWLVRAVGEIPALHFSPDELRQLAHAAGFRDTQTWPFPAQLAAFAPQARARRVASTQDVARLGTRSPPAT